MKIIGGAAKGKEIAVPKIIRPTQNILREAIFNIIDASFLKEAAVLDLFCGSGALGIEALSRGAKEAVFVDSQKICLSFVRKNLSVLGEEAEKRASLIKEDAFMAIKEFAVRGKKFDLVFADPPYYNGLGKKCLQALDGYDILHPAALVLIEHFKKDILDAEINPNFALAKFAQRADRLNPFGFNRARHAKFVKFLRTSPGQSSLRKQIAQGRGNPDKISNAKFGVKNLVLADTKQYGDTKLSIFRKPKKG